MHPNRAAIANTDSQWNFLFLSIPATRVLSKYGRFSLIWMCENSGVKMGGWQHIWNTPNPYEFVECWITHTNEHKNNELPQSPHPRIKGWYYFDDFPFTLGWLYFEWRTCSLSPPPFSLCGKCVQSLQPHTLRRPSFITAASVSPHLSPSVCVCAVLMLIFGYNEAEQNNNNNNNNTANTKIQIPCFPF